MYNTLYLQYRSSISSGTQGLKSSPWFFNSLCTGGLHLQSTMKNFNAIFFMLYFQKNASKHNYHQNENIRTKTKIVQMYLKSSSFLSMTLMFGTGACLHNTVKNVNTLFFMVYFEINTYKLTFHQNEKILLLFIYQMSFFAEQLYLVLEFWHRFVKNLVEWKKLSFIWRSLYTLCFLSLIILQFVYNFLQNLEGTLLQWVVIEKLI